jgi:putative ABC transport system permease protein
VKPIVARDQVALGPARCLKLALAGMSYRLFRSGITVSILGLAVAFLVHMLTYSIMAERTADGAAAELAESRQLGEIVTRIGSEDSPERVQAALALGEPARMREYARFAGGAELSEASRTARALAALARWLGELPPSARAVLLGDLTPEQRLGRVRDADGLRAFTQQLRELSLVLPDLDGAPLEALLLGARPELERAVARVIEGHRQAVAAVRRSYPGVTPEALAARPPAGLAEVLRGAGFEIEDGTVRRLADFGARLEARQRIARALLDGDVRAKLARRFGASASGLSLDGLARSLTRSDDAVWVLDVLKQADPTFDVAAPRLLELFSHWRRQSLLAAAAGERASAGLGAASGQGLFGLDARASWLLALSFLVCAVGVANAMLMSVTERFGEIATMKCLGAMDRFVMMMFVFEAVIQGVVGGVLGALVGLLLAALRGFAQFGALLGGALSGVGELGLAVLLSLVTGVVLAAAAAVGPAWVAARLSPMEAMRVD